MNIFEFAIKMEIDGEKFYKDQAKKYADSNLETICLLLAKDEARHAVALTNQYEHGNFRVNGLKDLDYEKNVYHDAKDLTSNIHVNPTQLDFYLEALKKEKESIELYEDYLKKTQDDAEIELFKYLIKQEQHHFNLLDDLSNMLTHAEEWVEDAEFGIRREEY